MAKERKFNIGKVAEDAEQTLRNSSSIPVVVGEENNQKPKEFRKSTPTLPQDTPTRFKGRKKVVRTIPKINGKTLYFEESVNDLLRKVAWNTQLDMQDIVRVAINDFLSTYCDGETLQEIGRNKVVEYVKSTSKIIE